MYLLLHHRILSPWETEVDGLVGPQILHLPQSLPALPSTVEVASEINRERKKSCVFVAQSMSACSLSRI